MTSLTYFELRRRHFHMGHDAAFMVLIAVRLHDKIFATDTATGTVTLLFCNWCLGSESLLMVMMGGFGCNWMVKVVPWAGMNGKL